MFEFFARGFRFLGDLLFNLGDPVSHLSFIFALVTLGVFLVLTGFSKRGFSEPGRTTLTSVLTFIIAFYAHRLNMYFGMTAFAGVFAGYMAQLLWSLIGGALLFAFFDFTSAIVQIVREKHSKGKGGGGSSSGEKGKAEIVDANDIKIDMSLGGSRPSGSSRLTVGFAMLVGVYLLVLLVQGVVSLWQNWGPNYKAQWAGLAHVTMHDVKDSMPDTDPNHMVMVTPAMAAYKGQTIIGSGGKNYGAIYHTDVNDYTLQSVAGHLWYIAPLVYSSQTSQYGWFTQAVYDSPGYIAVNAENPDAPAVVHDEFHMHYIPGSILNKDLTRHVYLKGYMYGELEDPTIEVDDNWKPFFTLTYTRKAFITSGDAISRVLVVDPVSGDIQDYAPGQVPHWVDRVMSLRLVSDYANYWTLWHAPNAQNWFNAAKQGEMKIDTPELHYNTADEPVWVIPVTSNNSKDSSTTGVLVYKTRTNEADWYPGLAGLGMGSRVAETMRNVRNNPQKIPVSSVQLYQIQGHVTWVGIFAQQHDGSDASETFGGIGMVDAKDLNTAGVVYQQNRDTALKEYSSHVVVHDANTGEVSNSAVEGAPVDGQIDRIGQTIVGGESMFVFKLKNDSHRYAAQLSQSIDLPMMHTGDQVHLTYSENKQGVRQVDKLVDSTVDAGTPVAPPGATTSPAAPKTAAPAAAPSK